MSVHLVKQPVHVRNVHLHDCPLWLFCANSIDDIHCRFTNQALFQLINPAGGKYASTAEQQVSKCHTIDGNVREHLAKYLSNVQGFDRDALNGGRYRVGIT